MDLGRSSRLALEQPEEDLVCRAPNHPSRSDQRNCFVDAGNHVVAASNHVVATGSHAVAAGNHVVAAVSHRSRIDEAGIEQWEFIYGIVNRHKTNL